MTIMVMSLGLIRLEKAKDLPVLYFPTNISKNLRLQNLDSSSSITGSAPSTQHQLQNSHAPARKLGTSSRIAGTAKGGNLLTLSPLQARASAHLALARISNAPTVVSNTLAGVALASVVAPVTVSGTVVSAFALLLYYIAGMYLNDLFDLELDRRERPERPLPSGRISHREALLTTVLLFSVGTSLLSLLGTAPLVCGLVLVALIVLYDARHKTNPLSPVVMASTRVMVYVTAFSAFSPVPTFALVFWALLLGLYLVGLTYIAKTETRTLTGYWPAALLYLPVLVGALALPWSGFWLPLALALWVTYSVWFVYGTRQVGRAIGGLIAGISLLDALVIALFGTFLGVLWALAAFVLTLYLQRYIRGT